MFLLRLRLNISCAIYLRLNIKGGEHVMKLVIVHLKLKNYSEEVIYVVWIRINNYIPDPFFLYLSQNRSRKINRNIYILSTQVHKYNDDI